MMPTTREFLGDSLIKELEGAGFSPQSINAFAKNEYRQRKAAQEEEQRRLLYRADEMKLDGKIREALLSGDINEEEAKNAQKFEEFGSKKHGWTLGAAKTVTGIANTIERVGDFINPFYEGKRDKDGNYIYQNGLEKSLRPKIKNVEKMRDDYEKATGETSWGSRLSEIGTELVGDPINFVGGVGLLSKGSKLAQFGKKTLYFAGTGAASGGVAALGEGKNDKETLENIGYGAVGGAFLGHAIDKGIQGISKLIAKRQASKMANEANAIDSAQNSEFLGSERAPINTAEITARKDELGSSAQIMTAKEFATKEVGLDEDTATNVLKEAMQGKEKSEFIDADIYNDIVKFKNFEIQREYAKAYGDKIQTAQTSINNAREQSAIRYADTQKAINEYQKQGMSASAIRELINAKFKPSADEIDYTRAYNDGADVDARLAGQGIFYALEKDIAVQAYTPEIYATRLKQRDFSDESVQAFTQAYASKDINIAKEYVNEKVANAYESRVQRELADEINAKNRISINKDGAYSGHPMLRPDESSIGQGDLKGNLIDKEAIWGGDALSDLSSPRTAKRGSEADATIISQKGNLINEEAKNSALPNGVSGIGDNASRAGGRQGGDEEILRQSRRNTADASEEKWTAKSDRQMEQRPAFKGDGDTDATASSKQMVEKQGRDDNEIRGDGFVLGDSGKAKQYATQKFNIEKWVNDLSGVLSDEWVANLKSLALKHPEMFKSESDVFKVIREIKNEPTHFLKNTRDDVALIAKRLGGGKVGNIGVKKDNGQIIHANKTDERDLTRLLKRGKKGELTRTPALETSLNKEDGELLKLSDEGIIPQKEINAKTINANSHIASGLVGGTLNSIDEDGSFNPEKFAAGFIAGLAGSKAVAIAVRKMTPQLYNKILGTAKKMPQMAKDNPKLLGKLYANGKDVSLNSFAGEKAITANVGKLDQAKAMLEKGADEVEIWQKTGWFKDKDGAWKFEIGDSKARLNPNFKSGGRLSELLEHKELFKAYPELKDIKIKKIIDEKGENLGYYDPNKKEIAINNIGDKSTLMHEVQHAIQEIEGFARGGEYDIVWNAAVRTIEKKYENELAKLEKIANEAWKKEEPLQKAYIELFDKGLKDSPEAQRLLKEREPYSKKGWEARNKIRNIKWAIEDEKNAITDKDMYEAYQKIHGEVEARNVQNRLNLDDAAGTHPYETFDINPNETFVSREDGISFSVKDALQKERRGVYNVAFNEKKSTIIRKDLDAIDEIIKFEKGEADYVVNGERKSGYGALHIKKHLDTQNNGWVSKQEYLDMGQMLRKSTMQEADDKRIYTYFNDDGVRFRVVVGTGKNKERIISFYSNRKPLKAGLSYDSQNYNGNLPLNGDKVGIDNDSLTYNYADSVRSSAAKSPIEHSSDGKDIIPQNEEKVYHRRNIEEIKREHPDVEKELDDSIAAMRKESFNDVNFKDDLISKINAKDITTKQLGKSVDLSDKQLAVLKNDIKNADFKVISDSKIYFDKMGRDGDKKRFFIDIAEDGKVRVDGYSKKGIDTIPVRQSALEELAGVGDRARLKNMSFEVKAAYFNELDPIKKEAILKTAELNKLKKAAQSGDKVAVAKFEEFKARNLDENGNIKDGLSLC